MPYFLSYLQERLSQGGDAMNSIALNNNLRRSPSSVFAQSGFRALARRLAITLGGGGLILIGLALLVLPGPGTLFIAGGLTLLATEYAFAARIRDAGICLLKRAWTRTIRRFQRSNGRSVQANAGS